jgi:hypothetical protein
MAKYVVLPGWSFVAANGAISRPGQVLPSSGGVAHVASMTDISNAALLLRHALQDQRAE